ncbi:uncharacterized protein LOC135477003 [Liolophura sinensis]|uniref:uncharacterized protein LOC135477003 n=1 Tax=Liolophura sinensis TaxID=3198878 RepID=UPI0031580CD2
MGFGSASIFTKIALLLAGLALLFHLIGYSSNSWQKAESFGQTIAEEGLWKTCNYAFNQGCVDYDVVGTSKIADEMRTVRAFTTIALLLMIAVPVAIVLSMFISLFRSMIFVIAQMGAAIAAGVLIIIAVIIYGSDLIPSNTGVHASWSLALSVVGAIFSIATGGLLVLGAFRNKSSE